MNVHQLFPASASEEPRAALDVMRDRHSMLVDLGHSLVDEDTFTRDELVIAALSTIDAAALATAPADRRVLLVRAAALIIAEVERADRISEQAGASS